MKTYNDLRNQLQLLQAQLEEVTTRERTNIIADINKKMQEYGIDVSELGATRKRSAKASPAKRGNRRKKTKEAAKSAQKSAATMGEVRYRDPASGATWSGRGRPPAWLTGKNREQFAVTH